MYSQSYFLSSTFDLFSEQIYVVETLGGKMKKTRRWISLISPVILLILFSCQPTVFSDSDLPIESNDSNFTQVSLFYYGSVSGVESLFVAVFPYTKQDLSSGNPNAKLGWIAYNQAPRKFIIPAGKYKFAYKHPNGDYEPLEDSDGNTGTAIPVWPSFSLSNKKSYTLYIENIGPGYRWNILAD